MGQRVQTLAYSLVVDAFGRSCSVELVQVDRLFLERKGLLFEQNLVLVELELTEGVLMSDTSDSLHKLNELRQLGIRLAIDDFGTGYSSLSYLKDFPVQTLKIDRAFVKNLGNDSGKSIVRAILAVADATKLTVVAEGVETEAQLEFLIENECDYAQGWLIAKALNSDEFLLELANWQSAQQQRPDLKIVS